VFEPIGYRATRVEIGSIHTVRHYTKYHRCKKRWPKE